MADQAQESPVHIAVQEPGARGGDEETRRLWIRTQLVPAPRVRSKGVERGAMEGQLAWFAELALPDREDADLDVKIVPVKA